MKRFAAIVLFLVPTVAEAAKPATRPEPTTIAEAKTVERADQEKQWAGMTSIGPLDIRQVVQIHLENNRVVVSSPLESFDTERSIKFRHADDFAKIGFHSMSPISAPDQPRFVQMYRYDFRDPKSVFFHTEILAHPGYAQIAGATQFLGEELRNVDIIDTDEKLNDSGGKDDAQIAFHVQTFDAAGSETHKIELTAPDLRTLQRKYPAEVNEYLRPVLRELDAESLLQVDPMLAWEVFAPDAHPAKELVEKVHRLVPKLDATNFAEREQTAELLKKMGAPAAVVLLQLDRAKLSPEQNSRLDDILADYLQLKPEQAQRLANDTTFLLDVMDSDELELRRVAMEHLSQVLGHPVAFDPSATPDVRRKMMDELRKQSPPPAETNTAEKLQQ